ncbi:unnamed protein product, partial [Echinostoma caproni]|uniref:Utp21 domain-containing protein n=1 Tax=Echinostoma caproni TaxID=27848 RepID=A0A183A3F0_9TREM
MEVQSDTTDNNVQMADSVSNEDLVESRYTSPDQLADTLATLSGLPVSHLTNFLNLDTVMERNRRAIAVQSDSQNQTALPFFLPVAETEKGLAWVDQSAGDGQSIAGEGKPQQSGPRVAAQKRRLDEENLTAMEPVPGLGTRLIQASTNAE